MKVKIGKRYVGDGYPTYVISEVGSNFDGDLDQAKYLVDLSKKVGADAIKFQSFKASKIVSHVGFKKNSAFQAKWEKPVYDVYRSAEFPRKWHKAIQDYCYKKKIDFFSSPYDKEAVDLLEDMDVPCHKIGSGDITHLELLEYIAKKGRPVILATGASNMGEIEEAVNVIRGAGNNDIVLLQCITNYPSPFEDANIRAMVTLRQAFNSLVGYSDHTPGSVVPLGAVALGGCMIEKHFTFDQKRMGPDHPFAMNVDEMSSMVRDIRLMEKALGGYIKKVEPSESETVVLQRRGLVAAQNVKAGETLTKKTVDALRPAKGIVPKFKEVVIGRKVKKAIPKGEPITWDNLA